MSQAIQPEPSPRPRPPLTSFAKGQEVSLGCGTLLLIAFIVALCSGAGKTDLGPVTSRLDEMQGRLQRLETKLDELSKKLNR
jgi:hypothetical protein